LLYSEIEAEDKSSMLYQGAKKGEGIVDVGSLSNDNNAAIEFVVGNFQVEWSRTLPDPSRRVVMRPVAGTIVTTKVASISNGHAHVSKTIW